MVRGVKIDVEKSNAILTLRFGSTVTKDIKNKLMGYSAISRLTKVAISTVRSHCLQYEQSIENAKPKAKKYSKEIKASSKYDLD